jgi:hypothetical protein
MKTSRLFLLLFCLFALAVTSCGEGPIDCHDADIPCKPLKIAVVCDFTASQDGSFMPVPENILSKFDHIFDSLLPERSIIKLYPVTSVEPPPSIGTWEYKWDHCDRDMKEKYITDTKKMWIKQLDSIIIMQCAKEQDPKIRNEGRSCIENSIINTGNFLNDDRHRFDCRILVISDFLEQCSNSSLAGRNPLWFQGGGWKYQISPDSLNAKVDRWDQDDILEGTKVYAIRLAIPNPKVAIMENPALENFWTHVFKHLGAGERSIDFVEENPSGLLEQRHFPKQP